MINRTLRVIYTCDNLAQLYSAVRYAELAGHIGNELVKKAVRIKKHELV